MPDQVVDGKGQTQGGGEGGDQTATSGQGDQGKPAENPWYSTYPEDLHDALKGYDKPETLITEHLTLKKKYATPEKPEEYEYDAKGLDDTQKKAVETFRGKVLTDPKGTYEGTQTWEWFPGGFSVVGKGEGVVVRGGPQNELMILGYSSTDKSYPGYNVSRSGTSRTVRKWSVNGNVWTCEAESIVDGKPATQRYTLTEDSPVAWTYKVERSVEGGPRTQTIDLKATKIK